MPVQFKVIDSQTESDPPYIDVEQIGNDEFRVTPNQSRLNGVLVVSRQKLPALERHSSPNLRLHRFILQRSSKKYSIGQRVELFE